MNPFLFKAHPLLRLTVESLAGEGGLWQALVLLLFYLIANVVWATALALVVREMVHIRPRPLNLYWMSLPALVGYVPVLLTLLRDVLDHTFRFADRFILLFALVTVASMLGALYGFLFRHPRSHQSIGLIAGFAVALAMLLISLPLGLALLKTELLAFLA